MLPGILEEVSAYVLHWRTRTVGRSGCYHWCWLLRWSCALAGCAILDHLRNIVPHSSPVVELMCQVVGFCEAAVALAQQFFGDA